MRIGKGLSAAIKLRIGALLDRNRAKGSPDHGSDEWRTDDRQDIEAIRSVYRSYGSVFRTHCEPSAIAAGFEVLD